MKRTLTLMSILTAGLLVPHAGGAPLGTAFTYRGQLKQAGQPVNDTCDFEFGLFDAPSDGNQIGTTQMVSEVPVSNGLFTVVVDFGPDAFNGEARWLEIAVRCPAGAGDFTTLSPRQELTPVPHALALPGLWTQQNATSPNLIGGFSGNRVTSGVLGGTIGGGGTIDSTNRVTDDYGTVGGGTNNLAGDNNELTANASYATVGGGRENSALAQYATVGGGFGNSANRPGGQGLGATVGGGRNNRATDGDYGTVGGGLGNRTLLDFSTVGGGQTNAATFYWSTVGGGQSNVAARHHATVGGGEDNTASDFNATVGGGLDNTASGQFATVPAGRSNTAAGDYSFAAGHRAQALHSGAFVWADSTDADFDSTTTNQFNVRATSGARFVMGNQAGLLALKGINARSTFTRAALQAENSGAAGASGEAAWLRTSRGNVNAPVLKLLRHPNGGGGNFYVEGLQWDGVNAPARKFHINANGTYVAGSDFAEALPARGGKADYAPGDVLVLSAEQPGSVEKCCRPYDVRVAGVYSTRPGFLGADKGGETRVDPDDIPVAITGIVPTKVTNENGPIQPGDLLTTSSTPGHAMKASPVTVNGIELYRTGAILGKAVEPTTKEVDLIKMLVTLQ